MTCGILGIVSYYDDRNFIDDVDASTAPRFTLGLFFQQVRP
jgi:hypothetical protein